MPTNILLVIDDEQDVAQYVASVSTLIGFESYATNSAKEFRTQYYERH